MKRKVQGVCGWCGKPFIKKHNKIKYCSQTCRVEARREQNRNRAFKWYHKHKHEKSEDQKFGLGSGWISNKRNTNFEREKEIIQNEKKRLKLQ